MIYLLLTVLLCVATSSAQPVVTWPIGFLNIPSPTQYEYGPSIISEGGLYYAFYCSPPVNSGPWDSIRMIKSSDGGSWSTPVAVLTPDNAFDAQSVCDPSVIKFHGVYYLYHTCINTINPPDGYKNNRICVAMADNIGGPYYIHNLPVIANISCAPTDTNIYCVGQPAALVKDDTVYVYFTQTYSNSQPGPNPGFVYLATSKNGIDFAMANNAKPLFSQRDVDVKYDRTNNLFVLLQGDVGDPHISYSLSKDGINFQPYTTSRSIATNPGLPSGGSNNNPGIASEPDGSFPGMTWVAYGSSYTVGWGDWHLYASGLVINPGVTNCTACTAYSCDFQCERVTGEAAYGECASPGGTDPGHCCRCNPYPHYPDCAKCSGGCVGACRGAGHKTGYCGNPGSSDPTNCCTCVD